MISHAINSGAINKVPFPSSELGASVIELLGESEVATTVNTLSLRLLSSAKTSPTASGTVNPKSKILFTAAVSPSAVALPTSIRVKVPSSGSTTATAVAKSAKQVFRFVLGASAAPSATASASSLSLVFRGGSVVASATPMAAGLRKLYLSISETATATVASPVAVNIAKRSAIQSAIAKPVVAFFLKRGIKTTTQAIATTTVGGRTKAFRSAKVAPAAASSAAISLHIRETLLGSPAAVGTSGIVLRATTAATATAAANGVSGFVFHLLAGATTPAEALAYVAAVDLSTNVPAPLDRQIVVPRYDRIMKVVA